MRPKLLILYHELPFSNTRDDILREVRKLYSGTVVAAEDLGVY